jgi:hypothetical protein
MCVAGGKAIAKVVETLKHRWLSDEEWCKMEHR